MLVFDLLDQKVRFAFVAEDFEVLLVVYTPKLCSEPVVGTLEGRPTREIAAAPGNFPPDYDIFAVGYMDCSENWC